MRRGRLKPAIKVAEYAPRVNEAGSNNDPASDAWICRLQCSDGARVVLRFLWDWKRRRERSGNRLVNPSVGAMAVQLGRQERTIQRHLRELQALGEVFRVYNGGRGKQSIFYLGRRARQMSEATPTWPEKSRKGGLGLGRVALRRRGLLGDQDVTLKPEHSSSVEIAFASQKENKAPDRPDLGEASLPLPLEAAPPPTPQGGASVSDLPAVAAPALELEEGPPAPAVAAGHARSRSRDPSAPTARPPAGGLASGQKGSRAAAWKAAPELWRAAWWLWRSAFARRFKRSPLPDIHDAVALRGLLFEACFWSRQNQAEALRYFAWGIVGFLRDLRPQDRGGHTLRVMRRLRVEYGAPRLGWKTPDFSAAPKPKPEAPPAAAVPSSRAAERARGVLEALERLPQTTPRRPA